jgi:hypothetical protein
LKNFAILTLAMFCHALAVAQVTKTELTQDGRLLVNGQPAFFIGTAPGPDIGLKTPEGGDGWAELASGGINVMRTFPTMNEASTQTLQAVRKYMDNAAAHGMFAWPFIWKPVEENTDESHETLQQIVNAFKSHPATFFWKFSDEPAWGNQPASALKAAYEHTRMLDPNHLVWIAQAPVVDKKQYNPATAERLAEFTPAADVFAIDIYPIPAGKHSPKSPNKDISIVGDYTKVIKEASGPNKLVFMILQVFWSGVNPKHNPKNTIVFPTAREERYMTYQAIINGANSLSYFGLCIKADPENPSQDLRLGCQWTFWRKVLKPLIAELRPNSPLYPALIAPDAPGAIRFTGAPQIEARIKSSGQAGAPLYILAAAREGKQQQVTFTGEALKAPGARVEVLFEKRSIQPSNGSFADNFAEHDVHLYRVSTTQPGR